jgi:peptidoglycan/LPS O-acetylase OafA/YrhL
MKNKDLIKSERVLFFHFVKSIGILGIFFFHFYGRFVGDLRIKNAVTSGLLQDLLVSVKSLSQFICFIAQTFFSFGNIGVDLFIIASGFGLYYSYLSKHTTWRAFFRKRIVRVLPLYYFFLFLIFCLAAFVSKVDFYTSSEGLKVLLYHVLLVQTFNGSYVYYGLYYFIAVIFQLYLLFPLLVKIIHNDKIRIPFFVLSILFSICINKIIDLSGINYQGILLTDYLPLFVFGMLVADSMYNERILHKVLFDGRLLQFIY